MKERPDQVDGVMGAGLVTAVAADAVGEVDVGFAVIHGDSINRTDPLTVSTSDTISFVDTGAGGEQ